MQLKLLGERSKFNYAVNELLNRELSDLLFVYIEERSFIIYAF